MIMAQLRSPSISSPAELAPMQKTIKRQPMQDRSNRLSVMCSKHGRRSVGDGGGGGGAGGSVPPPTFQGGGTV